LWELQSAVEKQGHHLEQIMILPGEAGNTDRVDFTLSSTGTTNISSVIDSLRHINGVRQISASN
jgi:hypothetical protein